MNRCFKLASAGFSALQYRVSNIMNSKMNNGEISESAQLSFPISRRLICDFMRRKGTLELSSSIAEIAPFRFPWSTRSLEDKGFVYTYLYST